MSVIQGHHLLNCLYAQKCKHKTAVDQMKKPFTKLTRMWNSMLKPLSDLAKVGGINYIYSFPHVHATHTYVYRQIMSLLKENFVCLKIKLFL